MEKLAKKLKEETIFNENGEKIHVRIYEKNILICHEDINDDFIPISQFLYETIISKDELIAIYNTIRKLNGTNEIFGLI